MTPLRDAQAQLQAAKDDYQLHRSQYAALEQRAEGLRSERAALQTRQEDLESGRDYPKDVPSWLRLRSETASRLGAIGGELRPLDEQIANGARERQALAARLQLAAALVIACQARSVVDELKAKSAALKSVASSLEGAKAAIRAGYLAGDASTVGYLRVLESEFPSAEELTNIVMSSLMATPAEQQTAGRPWSERLAELTRIDEPAALAAE